VGCIYYKRPAELALDHVPMVDVVIDVLRAEGSAGLQYDYVCMLYACSPFIKSESIVEGYKLLGKGFDVACPVFRGPHLERALLRRGDRMLSRFPEYDEERSNMWPDSYYHAGHFFWARRTTLLCSPYLHAREHGRGDYTGTKSVDIDEPEDWGLAEFKYQMLRGRHDRPCGAHH
jgi:N-acylneuraminate cytidylyltransferase